MEIIPAILVQDRETFASRLRLVEGIATAVQIDCMDGHFVPNRSWYEAEALQTTLGIELHLMVSDPLAVIREWKRVPQVMRAIWHLEIPIDHEAVIDEAHKLGWEAGLALSPMTPIERLLPYHERIDEVLILGVEPGFSGQKLTEATLAKIHAVKELDAALRVGFDGGVNQENLKRVIEAGADRSNLASAIFESPDPSETLRAILTSI